MAFSPSKYVSNRAKLQQWELRPLTLYALDLYYLSFPKDGRIPKSLVYTVYTIELAQTIIITRDAYTYYASGFGNLEGLDAVQTAWLSIPLFSGLGECSAVLHFTVFLLTISL